MFQIVKEIHVKKGKRANRFNANLRNGKYKKLQRQQ